MRNRRDRTDQEDAGRPVACDGALLARRDAGGGDVAAKARGAAEVEIAHWRHSVAYSLPRLLSAMAEGDGNPMQAAARWLRANCRGGWRHVAVPGGGAYFCMNDEACARKFRDSFGVEIPIRAALRPERGWMRRGRARRPAAA